MILLTLRHEIEVYFNTRFKRILAHSICSVQHGFPPQGFILRYDCFRLYKGREETRNGADTTTGRHHNIFPNLL